MLKRFFVSTLVLLVVTAGVSAQNRLRVSAGYVDANRHHKLVLSNDYRWTDNTRGIGFYLGGGCEFPVKEVKNLSAEALFLFTHYGNSDESFNLLNVPFMIKYKFGVCDNVKLFASCGPVVSIGLYAESEKDGKKVSLYKEDKLSRIDLKLGVNIGVEFYEDYSLTVGYNKGLFNQLGTSNANRTYIDVFNVGVTYAF